MLSYFFSAGLLVAALLDHHVFFGNALLNCRPPFFGALPRLGRERTIVFQNPDSEALGIPRSTDDTTRNALVRAVLNLPPDQRLKEIHLVGQMEMPAARNSTITCAVLSEISFQDIAFDSGTLIDPHPCLLLPLTSPSQLTLLRSAISRDGRVSKVQLLAWNALAVNRDGGLFDNLPYSSWTIDPYRQDYKDSAGNPILERFHTGKRDTYNRMMGKDWMFLPVSKQTSKQQEDAGLLSNLLERTLLQNSSGNMYDAIGDQVSSPFQIDERDGLSRRITELRVRELSMDLADCDYQLAVAKSNQGSQVNVDEIQKRRKRIVESIENNQRNLRNEIGVKTVKTTEKKSQSSFMSLFENAFRSSNSNPPPYPGATGYRPMMPSEYNESVSVHTNPYDMFRDILRDQMKAEVVGCVLENSSLLDGTLTLGGAIVLRRLDTNQQVNIMGETLQVRDENEDYGNDSIVGGSTILVECDADEAVCMSLVCNLPLQVEQSAWEKGSVMATMNEASLLENRRHRTSLPCWNVLDPELSVLTEGEARNETVSERVSPVRIPRTTVNLFDEISRGSSGATSSSLFPTDNPVQSLSQYDNMSNDDKARTLLGMSNFAGKLPRPRVLRNAPDGQTNALDELLLPLVDESVRNQYLVRDAEKRRDWNRVEELVKNKSKRQVAKEKAEDARSSGSEDVADWWENEAEFLASLRADPTQDEGSYSRFLDRDEWYERQRANQAKRLERKKFGNLLDGIE